MSTIARTLTSVRNPLLKAPYAALDTEYKFNPGNRSKPYTLYAASIVDSEGNIKARHIMDFRSSEPEKELAIWFIQELLQYRLTIGWYSTGVKIQRDDGTCKGKDSDLKVLDTVCRYYDIPSIISFDRRGSPYVRGYDHELCRIDSYYADINKHSWYYHIDLYRVYEKAFVRSMIYHNTDKDLSLDTVCKTVLGEGKYKDLEGLQIQRMTREEQLEYVAQDARLVMKLSQHDDFKILDLMSAISRITMITFDKVCHTKISTWWTRMIKDATVGGKCRQQQVLKKQYSGGYVLEPKPSFYVNEPVRVLDVASLYPTMMIANNLSFETVNCSCCKSNPDAMVGDGIMSWINCSMPKDEKREQYWICKSYVGIVPQLLQQFKDERFRQRELGNEPTQLALKNLINGCYGLFGSEFFEFRDYRVAELTTAFGRDALEHMRRIAKEVYGFDVIYGDTDSIFVTGVKDEIDIKKFISECHIMHDIDVEPSNVYTKFLITKKKHYIGIDQDESKEPDIKGMEGIKIDRPSWINKIEKQFASDIKYGKDPTLNIRKQYREMESGRVPLEELQIKLTLAKNPQEYAKNSLQRVVGMESDATQGSTIRYYKSETAGGGTSNPNLLSRRKYLEMLSTTVEDSLKVMGYDYMRDIAGCQKIHDYSR